MHDKFINGWCRTYDTLCDSIGEEAAITFISDLIGYTDWLRVVDRLPDYFREKHKQEHLNGRNPQ